MNTIYTAALNYRPEHLLPFLISAQRHLRDFEAVLLIRPEDQPVLQPLAARFPFVRFELVSLGTKFERALCWVRFVALREAVKVSRRDRHTLTPGERHAVECGLNPALSRYFVIERALRRAGQEADRVAEARVMLCDSRDLIFQGDAFRQLDHPLTTGAEPVVVGRRDQWIGTVYGPEGQARMHRRQVFCSGFTVGRLTDVRAYVARMVDELWAHLPSILFHRGLDQAVHIRLLHDGLVKAHICQNHEGRIATVSMEGINNIHCDESSGQILVHGHAPCVLHQYDRHPELMAFVARHVADNRPEH